MPIKATALIVVEIGMSDNPHHPAQYNKVRDHHLGTGVLVYVVTNFRFKFNFETGRHPR